MIIDDKNGAQCNVSTIIICTYRVPTQQSNGYWESQVKTSHLSILQISTTI